MFLCPQAVVVQVRGHPAVVEAAVAAEAVAAGLLLTAHQVVPTAAAEVPRTAIPAIHQAAPIEADRAAIAQVPIVRLRIAAVRIEMCQPVVSRSGSAQNSREDIIAIRQVIKRRLHIIAENMIMCIMHWDG